MTTTNRSHLIVSILGVSPLLWHYFGPDTISLTKKEKTGVTGNDPQEWRRTVLVDDNGLYVQANYAFGSLSQGGKFVPAGKGRSTAQRLVVATLKIVTPRLYVTGEHGLPLRIPDDLDPLDPAYRDETLPVYLDVRSVVNPMTKGRNMRYRIAAAPGWRITFEVSLDKTILSRDKFDQCVVEAGANVGIADGRQIGMGRFEVEAIREA